MQLRDMSQQNYVQVNEQNAAEVERIRQLKVRYGGRNLNQQMRFIKNLPKLDQTKDRSESTFHDRKLSQPLMKTKTNLVETPLSNLQDYGFNEYNNNLEE